MKVGDEKAQAPNSSEDSCSRSCRLTREKAVASSREFAKLTSSPSMAVVDLREFPIPVRVEYLCRAIGGEVVACKDKYVKEVNGYTVIDSTKAVEAYSGSEYAQLFGATTERALSFHKRGSRLLAHDDCAS